jgi:hypothetical protein
MVSIHCMLSVRNLVGGCSVVSESSGEPVIAHAVVIAILEYEGYQVLFFREVHGACVRGCLALPCCQIVPYAP